MQRIPDQFDPRAQATLSAAGGGSTSTTCSSSIVTLAVASVGPAMLFSRLAETAPPAPEGGRALSKRQAKLLGFTAPLLSVLATVVAFPLGYMFFSGTGVLALLGIGAWLGVFGYVYQRTQGSSSKGVGIGVLWLVGLTALIGVEIAIWLSLM